MSGKAPGQRARNFEYFGILQSDTIHCNPNVRKRNAQKHVLHVPAQPDTSFMQPWRCVSERRTGRVPIAVFGLPARRCALLDGPRDILVYSLWIQVDQLTMHFDQGPQSARIQSAGHGAIGHTLQSAVQRKEIKAILQTAYLSQINFIHLVLIYQTGRQDTRRSSCCLREV